MQSDIIFCTTNDMKLSYATQTVFVWDSGMKVAHNYLQDTCSRYNEISSTEVSQPISNFFLQVYSALSKARLWQLLAEYLSVDDK